jgi:hypothetical protein
MMIVFVVLDPQAEQPSAIPSPAKTISQRFILYSYRSTSAG